MKTFPANEIHYINSYEKYAPVYMGSLLYEFLNKYSYPKRHCVLLCVGSSRITGDSIGPSVGKKLTALDLPNVSIYGTLEEPVHALNLEESLVKIKSTHEDALIIAIDASLGIQEHIGYITLANRPLQPGLGVNKNLSAVGHLSMTGIVSTSGLFSKRRLESIPVHSVRHLSNTIALSISFGIHLTKKRNFF